jgi:hypothetical protein
MPRTAQQLFGAVLYAPNNTFGRSVFVASGTGLLLRPGGAGTLTLNSISVSELPGYHATQPTAGNRPTLVRLANGRWGLSFDGTTSFLPCAYRDLYNAPGATSIAAYSATARSDSFLFGNTSGSNDLALYIHQKADISPPFFANQVFIRNDSGGPLLTHANNVSPAFGSGMVVVSRVDLNSTLTPYLNGVQGSPASYTRSGTLTTNRLVIGALWRTSTVNFLLGQVACIAAVPSALPDPTRIAIERFAAAHAGAPYLG